ncbi:MAG: hypothetical protein DI634_00075 [Kocuria palustris]|nr:MAG: hypothetical protein DI634_00075 [Kocuria palustris]
MTAMPRSRQDPSPPGPSAIMPSQFGILRATLTAASLSGATTELPPRGGIGIWTDPAEAPSSWSPAVIAMRLTEPDMQPVVDAADLGSMLLLAQSCDPQDPSHDITTLLRLDDRQLEVLQALVSSESIRAAASTLGMHHATVQTRHEALCDLLGYDPRTVTGRMRYLAAAVLARLTAPGRI